MGKQAFLLQGLNMVNNSIIYNKNFNDSINKAVGELIQRTPAGHPPRLSRKNGASLLDEHFSFILQKLSEHKTQGQILSLINTKLDLKINKSTLSRFLKKKMGGKI